MTNEEKKMKQLFGKDNHFKVPEEYFGNLANQIMAKIPEQEISCLDTEVESRHGGSNKVAIKIALWQRIHLRRIAASMAAVVVLGTGLVIGLHSREHLHAQMARMDQNSSVGMMRPGHQIAHSISGTSIDEAEFDQMADYAMIDSQDIYASLIAEN